PAQAGRTYLELTGLPRLGHPETSILFIWNYRLDVDAADPNPVRPALPRRRGPERARGPRAGPPAARDRDHGNLACSGSPGHLRGGVRYAVRRPRPADASFPSGASSRPGAGRG